MARRTPRTRERELVGHVVGRTRCDGEHVTLRDDDAPGFEVVYCTRCHTWEARVGGEQYASGMVFDYAAAKHLRDSLRVDGFEVEAGRVHELLVTTAQAELSNSRLMQAAAA
jgi:hypothetical protein